MRKPYLGLILVALLACLSGCVPVDALNPYYTDRNVIFDTALLGKWAVSNPDEGILRFDRGEGDSYQMVVSQKQSSGWTQESVFQVHLISLGGEKYLDVSPKQLESTGDRQYFFRSDPAKKGSRFEPTLEQIDSGIYLEVLGPASGKGNSQELQVKLRSAHWIYKVDLNEKTLSLSFLDKQWVEEAIKKKMLQAQHLKANTASLTGWVLSGSTAELQQFVVQHADDPGAFDGAESLTKVEPPTLHE